MVKVKVMDTIDGVSVINICDWVDAVFGKGSYPDFSETSDALRKWCAANDAVYYGAPREDFFIWKGVDYAKEQGKSVVIVEDLS